MPLFLSLVYDCMLNEAPAKTSFRYVKDLPPALSGKPLQIVLCFKGDVGRARQNLFRLRLLLGCTGLAADTTVFC